MSEGGSHPWSYTSYGEHIPRSIYRLEGMISLAKEVDMLELAERKILRQFQGLPNNTANMTVYALFDSCNDEILQGTGNVLKIQKLQHICSEHDEKKDEDNNDKKDDKKKKDDKEKEKDKSKETATSDLSAQQSIAVLGIALIAMGEDIGGRWPSELLDIC
ncbi:PSMD2 [Mytilus edulis]|uniref:PSMD2 n=1 Tax=Mytilus edulis TaxID=6550 RepID=A0A8S3TLN6_MYTED|nr:PSMD2 [Mytilus edulis]